MDNLTEIYELNEEYLVYGDAKNFDSDEHFIEVALNEYRKDYGEKKNVSIANVRIEKCVVAWEGLPSCEWRPLNKAFLEFRDCYVGLLQED